MFRKPLTEYERQARESRNWQMICIFLLLVVMILGATCFVQSNRKYETRLVEFNVETGRYRVLPSNFTKEQRNVLIERALESYIQLRINTEASKKLGGFINYRVMSEVMAQSSPKVAAEYKKETKRTFEEGGWNKRRVKVTSSNLESSKTNLWRYDIIITDYFYKDKNKDPETSERRYVLHISYSLMDTNIFTTEELKLNPMGIKIEYFKNQYNE